jgi:hypothetical protein
MLRYDEIDMLDDVGANRAGLLADKLAHDWLDLRTCSAAEQEHYRDLRPTRGSWEWARWTCVGCPGCAMIDVSERRLEPWDGRSLPAQTRWHVLSGCTLAQLPEVQGCRESAVAWLERHAEHFGAPSKVADVIDLLSGQAHRIHGNGARESALRFCLGLPWTPDDEWAKSETLQRGYCRGFLRPIIRLFKAHVSAAARVQMGWGRNDLFSCIRWRLDRASLQLANPNSSVAIPTSRVLRRRCVREAWHSRQWGAKCFRAWSAYAAACGPTAFLKSVLLHQQGGANQPQHAASSRTQHRLGASVAAIMQLHGGAVREGWTSRGEALPSYRMWRRACLWRRWRLDWEEARGDGDDDEPTATSLVLLRAPRAALLSRGLTEKEAQEEAGREMEVARWMDKLVHNVEREVKRGEAEMRKMVVGLVGRAERASHKRPRRPPKEGSHASEVQRKRVAFAEGQLPDAHDRYLFDHILHVRLTQTGAAQFLVRWVGEHDDTWEPYGNLKPAFKPAARRLALRVLGKRIRTPRALPPPPDAGSGRFKRLVRLRDGGRFALECSPRARASGGQRVPDAGTAGERKRARAEAQLAANTVDLPPEVGGGGGAGAGRVVMDDLEEMDLRGDKWRERVASRGRSVKRRTS